MDIIANQAITVHSSHMNTGSIDHAGDNHGNMGSDDCSMNMIFSWSYKDTCVVFRWWHIRTLTGLICSSLLVSFLSYAYEFMKYYIQKKQFNSSSSISIINDPILGRQNRLIKSSWYGIQVGFSFFLMLVFMTYNGWLMIAVVLGSIWGNYSWGYFADFSNEQMSLTCH